MALSARADARRSPSWRRLLPLDERRTAELRVAPTSIVDRLMPIARGAGAAQAQERRTGFAGCAVPALIWVTLGVSIMWTILLCHGPADIGLTP
jgi:hypothetical protein